MMAGYDPAQMAAQYNLMQQRQAVAQQQQMLAAARVPCKCNSLRSLGPFNLYDPISSANT